MDLNKMTLKRFLLVIFLSALVVYSVFNMPAASGLIKKGVGLLQPFLIGAVIAFVLNVPLRFFEDFVFKKIKNEKFKKYERMLSIFLSIVMVWAIVILVISVVLPQLIDSITLLVSNIPSYLEKVSGLLKKIPDESGTINKYISDLNHITPSNVEKAVRHFAFNGSSTKTVLSTAMSTLGIVSSVFTVLLDLVIAFVFSIYILTHKERLARQARQICYAFFDKVYAEYIIHVFQVSFSKFYNFITGQLTEAVILGVLCTIGMLLLHFPYALMIGVLTGFCALIPIVGALIGGIVGTLLILTVSPAKALGFLVFLTVLQQIEGHVIYPHVVGGSVGLPSMWTLFAITIGGTLMGLVGMLIFVPICAAIYFLFAEFVHARLSNKDISLEGPEIVEGLK